MDPDEGDEALEIMNEYRRRLTGAKYLRRPAKAAAYRAAREWFRGAMAALKEQQIHDRYAKMLERRLRRQPRRRALNGPT